MGVVLAPTSGDFTGICDLISLVPAVLCSVAWRDAYRIALQDEQRQGQQTELEVEGEQVGHI